MLAGRSPPPGWERGGGPDFGRSYSDSQHAYLRPRERSPPGYLGSSRAAAEDWGRPSTSSRYLGVEPPGGVQPVGVPDASTTSSQEQASVGLKEAFAPGSAKVDAVSTPQLVPACLPLATSRRAPPSTLQHRPTGRSRSRSPPRAHHSSRSAHASGYPTALPPPPDPHCLGSLGRRREPADMSPPRRPHSSGGGSDQLLPWFVEESKLSGEVKAALADAFATGQLTKGSVLQSNVVALIEMPVDLALEAVREFTRLDKSRVKHPAAFFSGVMRRIMSEANLHVPAPYNPRDRAAINRTLTQDPGHEMSAALPRIRHPSPEAAPRWPPGYHDERTETASRRPSDIRDKPMDRSARLPSAYHEQPLGTSSRAAASAPDRAPRVHAASAMDYEQDWGRERGVGRDRERDMDVDRHGQPYSRLAEAPRYADEVPRDGRAAGRYPAEAASNGRVVSAHVLDRDVPPPPPKQGSVASAKLAIAASRAQRDQGTGSPKAMQLTNRLCSGFERLPSDRLPPPSSLPELAGSHHSHDRASTRQDQYELRSEGRPSKLRREAYDASPGQRARGRSLSPPLYDAAGRGRGYDDIRGNGYDATVDEQKLRQREAGQDRDQDRKASSSRLLASSQEPARKLTGFSAASEPSARARSPPARARSPPPMLSTRARSPPLAAPPRRRSPPPPHTRSPPPLAHEGELWARRRSPPDVWGGYSPPRGVKLVPFPPPRDMLDFPPRRTGSPPPRRPGSPPPLRLLRGPPPSLREIEHMEHMERMEHIERLEHLDRLERMDRMERMRGPPPHMMRGPPPGMGPSGRPGPMGPMRRRSPADEVPSGPRAPIAIVGGSGRSRAEPLSDSKPSRSRPQIRSVAVSSADDAEKAAGKEAAEHEDAAQPAVVNGSHAAAEDGDRGRAKHRASGKRSRSKSGSGPPNTNDNMDVGGVSEDMEEAGHHVRGHEPSLIDELLEGGDWEGKTNEMYDGGVEGTEDAFHMANLVDKQQVAQALAK